MRHALIISMLLLATAPACSQQETAETTTQKADPEAGCGTELMRPRGSSATSSPIETKVRTPMPNTVKSEEEWRRQLTPEQFRVLREKGTEPAFTGAFYRHDQVGNYRCAGCGSLLFTSREKYHSGSGWPSFNAPAEAGTLTIQTDHSYGMTRDEVLCANCGGHLGHVFDDGPKPTGKRYCINSASLEFEEDANERER